MRLLIHHTTRYAFENPVTYGLQQLRKTPKTGHGQRVTAWETLLEGGGRKELSFTDHHNNLVELLSFERDTRELIVTSRGEVELAETHGIVGLHTGPAPLWLFERGTPRTRLGPGGRALMREARGETDLERLHHLMQVIRDAVAYDVGRSDPYATAEQAVETGVGVCQDHAHIFLACAREMGFPARYVSGYLMLDDRVEQEAMHAWAEAHLAGLGWVGFDVSNGISPDRRYVRVATGLDYSEAAPVTGTRIGGQGETLSVQIAVAQQ